MKIILKFFLFFFLFRGVNLSAQLIEDFSETTINDEIYRPIGIRFDDIGNAYVWERNGVVHIIDSSGVKLPEPLIDISEEVGSWGDHGCLGFALDPDFLQNGFFYLFYVVDRHHLIYYGTPEYQADSTLANQATIGRITRYQANPSSNFTTIVEGSRKILLGETKESGIPILIASHGVGSLVFGTDGTLLASCGDSGSFLSFDSGSDPNTYFQQALEDGILKPEENVGSFRSLMVDALNGKILRIDPNTGDGISSNPFYDEQNPRAAKSRVYALGLRNPFRFTLKPNTGSHNPQDGEPGTLFIGDVGGSKWEELNICDKPAMNFGYPLFEGMLIKPGYWAEHTANPEASNPLYLSNSCDKEFYDFQDLIQQTLQNQSNTFLNPCDPQVEIDPEYTAIHTPPVISYANKLSNKPARAHISTFNNDGFLDTLNITDPQSPFEAEAFNGYTSVAGLFYEGENFPEEYQGKYFHADYSWWIRTMDFDENNKIQGTQVFHDNSPYILDLAINPKDGCIYYVDFHSRIQRISFGGNNPPKAIAKYDTQYGSSPLNVNFKGDESFDPEGTNLSYLWDFGDGMTSDLPNPSHTFVANNTIPSPFEISLTVSDSLGATDQSRFVISLNNTPPDVEIISFSEGDFYSINGYSILPLEAEVFDLEHNEEQLSYSWTTVLKHNIHEHAEAPVNQTTTQTFIEPVGCNGEEYWYQIQLAVEDEAGLIGRDTANLFPYCDSPFFNLINWNGKVEDTQILLNWELENGGLIDRIELQKINLSVGVQTLGILSPENSVFTFTDESPILGFNNYRLKIYKDNSTFDFSPEIRILFPPQPKLLLYPNPSSTMITFELAEVFETVELEIFDAKGSKILEANYDQTTFDINIENLAAGIYSYRLRNGETILFGNFAKLP